MIKIAQITLFPYFAYLGVKSLLGKLKRVQNSLKNTNYPKWLLTQEARRKELKISNQKIVAVLDDENTETINALRQSGIDFTIEFGQSLSIENKQFIEKYNAVLFLKSGELIQPYFKQGLPIVKENNIIYFDCGHLAENQSLPNDPLPGWSAAYFWSKNYISRSFLVHPSNLTTKTKLGDDILSELLVGNDNLIVHHHAETLVHLQVADINLGERKKLVQAKFPSALISVNAKFPLFDIHFPIKDSPLISIIIPTKDGTDVLLNCLQSIENKSAYHNYEFIILDNNSTTRQFKEFKAKWSNKDNCTFINHHHPFNYSELNNLGAKCAKGTYLVFLNNDTEVISENWLNDIVGQLQQQAIGAVGTQLLFSDNSIQHAGVQLGIEGAAGHVFSHIPIDEAPEISQTSYNYKTLTGACLAVSKENFELVNGFDEQQFAVEFNDLDLCLKLREKGLKNVYLPFVKLYHYESLSRGSSHKSWSSLLRYRRERKAFLTKWSEQIWSD